MEKSIPQVIERMRAIEGAERPDDGVAVFTRMYRGVTELVEERLLAGDFEDPRFMERLDIEFAGLFFAACDRYFDQRGDEIRAWRPLFASRTDHHVASLRFALAGMNAHINRDLMVAVVRACEAVGVVPARGTPQHRDFLHINRLLAKEERHVKAWLAQGWLGRITPYFGGADDAVAMALIGVARDVAWANAERLWTLRNRPALFAGYVSAIDHLVGLGSRGLLAGGHASDEAVIPHANGISAKPAAAPAA